MSRRKPHKHQSGLTLIEVLIATGIIASIVVYAVTTLQGTSRGVRSTNHHIHAQEQANNALENVRAIINNDGTICTAPTPTTSTSSGATFTTTTQLTHVRSTDTTASSFDAFAPTTCEDAQAVRVNITVDWRAGEGEAPARHELNSSISLVSLSSPTFANPPGSGGGGGGGGSGTVTSSPAKVAQGQIVTVNWNEGDTLPIPRYTLTHPASATDATGAVTTVSPVTWDGPDAWTGSPSSRSGTIQSEDGFTLNLTVTRDRDNTLEFAAQRSGTHTLDARNVMDHGTQNFHVHTVMEPSLEITPANRLIQYGSYPSFAVSDFYDGTDEAVTATLESATPENPFHYQWDESNISAFRSNPINLSTFSYPPPVQFPAMYSAYIDNLYTDTYGHTPNKNDIALEVLCIPPRILEFRQGPSRVTEAGLYNMYIEVNPENVPDGILTIRQNGTLSTFDPPLVATTGDHQIPVPQSPDPVEIEFPYVAGPAGTDTLEFTISSAQCNDPVPAALVVDIPVDPPPPQMGTSDPSAFCRINVGVHLDTPWSGSYMVSSDHSFYESDIEGYEEFVFRLGGRNIVVKYPIVATYVDGRVDQDPPNGTYSISGEDSTETYSANMALIETYLIQHVGYARGSPASGWGPESVGTERDVLTCMAHDSASVTFPPPPIPPCDWRHDEQDIEDGICEP